MSFSKALRQAYAEAFQKSPNALENLPLAKRNPHRARRIYGSLFLFYGGSATLMGLYLLGAGAYGAPLTAAAEFLGRLLLALIGVNLFIAGLSLHEAANKPTDAPALRTETAQLRFLYHCQLHPALLIAVALLAGTGLSHWTLSTAAAAIALPILIARLAWKWRTTVTSFQGRFGIEPTQQDRRALRRARRA